VIAPWDVDEGLSGAMFDAQCEWVQRPGFETCCADTVIMAAGGDPTPSVIRAGDGDRHVGTLIAADRELRMYYNRVEGQRVVERGSAA
jgi:hypothetical protein